MGIVVSFANVRRAQNGNVQGDLKLKWDENVLGNNVVLIDASHPFDCPRGGEQQVFDQGFDVGVIKVTAKAKVFEKGGNSICVQGRVEAKAVGVNLGKDLDENCQPVP